MKRTIATAVLVLTALFGVQTEASAELGVKVIFSDSDIAIIGAWYRDQEHMQSHGNGGKKAKGLPPGIAKNLARGKPLPPGIAKKQLPDGLRQLLPAPPHGYERIIVDGKVLLVEIATRVIHDILVDVVLH
jgi:Ni/Co efflux regulator RcnB